MPFNVISSGDISDFEIIPGADIPGPLAAHTTTLQGMEISNGKKTLVVLTDQVATKCDTGFHFVYTSTHLLAEDFPKFS